LWIRLGHSVAAQLTAQIANATLHSDDDTPSSSEEEYEVYGRAYKYEGAAAWLEDAGVLDSSDDIDVAPDSDSE
jgi:hypothetical protein